MNNHVFLHSYIACLRVHLFAEASKKIHLTIACTKPSHPRFSTNHFHYIEIYEK